MVLHMWKAFVSLYSNHFPRPGEMVCLAFVSASAITMVFLKRVSHVNCLFQATPILNNYT